MHLYQLLLNNTLLSHVHNKLLIVLFNQIVCTISTALRESSTIVDAICCVFFSFSVSGQAITRRKKHIRHQKEEIVR